MRAALRRRVTVALLIALAFPLVSCDSGGSGGGEPIWIGDWKVTSVDGGEGEVGNYWTLSREELEVRDVSTRNGETTCGIIRLAVSNVSGNEVEFVEPNLTLRFEGSGDQITATTIEKSIDPEDVGGTVTLQSVDRVPDCN